MTEHYIAGLYLIQLDYASYLINVIASNTLPMPSDCYILQLPWPFHALNTSSLSIATFISGWWKVV